MTVKELFDFVVDPQIDEKDQEEALEKLSGKASQRTEDERSAQEQIEAEVFKQIFIPRKLIEVNFEDIQKDIAKAKSDQVCFILLAGCTLKKLSKCLFPNFFKMSIRSASKYHNM